MDEYEASRLRIEKISTAVQTVKESLTCRICLELFNEPVTIKCGHKFCRKCIIEVTNNENSCCPFCSKKIQKRSIPKEGNKLLQASVQHFENLVKAIQTDSGIDVLQPQNKTKDTKESAYDYEKPSTSKVQYTPSTSKGSSSTVNQSLIKPKVPNPVRSRLSLTKKKADSKSPSQGSQKNSLHKYLSNKSDPVPDQVIHSQEKVKSWLQSCSTEEDDSDSVQQSKKLEDSHTADQIVTPPDQIYSSPQINGTREAGVSPLPPSEAGSESKFKETHLRVQEAEMMAKKKKMSLSLKDKSNVRTPNSIPATSHSDASDWRRIKQGGREMQVKTFKTLNVSIEKKSSPPVVLDDTVPYNSTNNDSKNISRDSEANNSSVDKTLQSRKRDSLKSENNNLLNKSSQIVIEDYKHRSMDSTGSPKPDIAAYNVNQSQVNEIIGVESSASVSKTPEKIRSSLSSRNKTNFSFRLDKLSPQKSKSNSGQELSDNESSNRNNKASTVINLQNSPPRKRRLSLKKSRDSTNSKNSSPPGTPEKINEKAEEPLNYFSPEKPKSSLLPEPLQNRTNRVSQKLTPIDSPLSDNLANRRSSLVTNGRRISFTKLGKICKPKRKVPFLYLGKLDKEKCIFIGSTLTSHKKPMPVIKSSVSVQIDYNSEIGDRNEAELEKYLPDKPHSMIVSPNGKQQLRSPIGYSPVNNHEEPMNIDEDFDFQRQGQSHQQMEIDVTLPPAKMIVKNHSDFEENSDFEKAAVEKKEDPSLKMSKGKRKNLKNKELEEISPQIEENVPEPSKSTYENTTSRKPEKEIKKCSPIPESSSKASTSTKSLKSAQNKVLTEKSSQKKVKIDKIPDDLISISSGDSEVCASIKKNVRKIDRPNSNEPSKKIEPKIDRKSFKESCMESEIPITSGKRGEENVEDADGRYSSASSSSLRPVKKKRTHSQSSNDDDDVDNILHKWMNTDKDQVTKKPKISLDSEEVTNVTKRRVRSKYSIESSSEDEEETSKENKQPSWSLFEDKEPEVKNPVTEAKNNKLTAMPSSMLSADLFESNEPSVQLTAQVPNQQNHGLANIRDSAFDSDTHSDKENMSERSQDNVTVVEARQLKKRKSVFSTDDDDKESTEFKQTSECEKSVKMTEQQTDEIESSQKDKNKTVDNFEHESDLNFGRESLFNVTQERLAYKNVEKDLFGCDLSKIAENQNEETPNIDKFSTPQRKPKSSEENDDFDSDNIAPTPVSKRRHAMRFPSSQSSSNTERNASAMFSPRRKTILIPAITPVKNTKSYPLCHSTPMISTENSPNLTHSQIERIKMVGSSLNLENTKLVHQFVNRFHAQYQANFDEDVTHVVVKVDPETKAGPKTFKYIQGIAFKKHVVSLQWIRDCLAKNELVDADDEKYDVLDPDTLQSGSKKSRLSSEKLFNNFAFCCLEPFEKVPAGEFKELLSYNGAVVVNSIPEFHLHNDKLKVIIVGSDELDDESIQVLNRVEAIAVHFEWVVDSFSQFQVLAVPSYLCETTTDKAMRLGFPPELLIEEETLEEEEEEEEE